MTASGNSSNHWPGPELRPNSRRKKLDVIIHRHRISSAELARPVEKRGIALICVDEHVLDDRLDNQGLQETKTVELLKCDVRNYRVRSETTGVRQRRFAVRGLECDAPGAFDRLADRLSARGILVDEQNARTPVALRAGSDDEARPSTRNRGMLRHDDLARIAALCTDPSSWNECIARLRLDSR